MIEYCCHVCGRLRADSGCVCATTANTTTEDICCWCDKQLTEAELIVNEDHCDSCDRKLREA